MKQIKIMTINFKTKKIITPLSGQLVIKSLHLKYINKNVTNDLITNPILTYTVRSIFGHRHNFVWPPLFSSTAWTLLGMEFTRASQVSTGFLSYSSMTTSRSRWMLKTLRSSTFRLRMPHRCSKSQSILCQKTSKKASSFLEKHSLDSWN